MSSINPVALKAKFIFGGTITALTGLHIGGSDTGLAIGGADKLVVREPRNNRPYIPGSSLKGKMRSLVEKVRCAGEGCTGFKLDASLTRGPCDCGSCAVCLVFGVPASIERKIEEGKPYGGASRLLVRDAFLANAAAVDQMRNLDMPFTEIKTEVQIDRLTSRANPRVFERVPAGAEFVFELMLNVFEGDDEEGHIQLIQQGLGLVADDAVGGQSSRGYGQVEIVLKEMMRVTAESYRDEAKMRADRGRNMLEKPVVFGGRLSPVQQVA
jgi:CRISPR-associated protein Csm3